MHNYIVKDWATAGVSVWSVECIGMTDTSTDIIIMSSHQQKYSNIIAIELNDLLEIHKTGGSHGGSQRGSQGGSQGG